MNEYYPTLLEMLPRAKKYPVSRLDGWHVFRGPKVWQIAPDDYLVVTSNEPKQLLSTLIDTSLQSGKKFFVLLFDGIGHGDTTTDTTRLAKHLDTQYPDLVDAVVITNYYETRDYDVVDDILWDMDGFLAQKYGATGQSIYVIDENKTIVWKSCGLMIDKLEEWLQTM